MAVLINLDNSTDRKIVFVRSSTSFQVSGISNGLILTPEVSKDGKVWFSADDKNDDPFLITEDGIYDCYIENLFFRVWANVDDVPARLSARIGGEGSDIGNGGR